MNLIKIRKEADSIVANKQLSVEDKVDKLLSLSDDLEDSYDENLFEGSDIVDIEDLNGYIISKIDQLQKL